MGVKVTCKLTGEKIEKKDAFCVKLDGKKVNSYFTSEDHYNEFINRIKVKEKQKEYRELCLSKIRIALGLSDFEKIDKMVIIKIEKLSQSYGYASIINVIDLFYKDIIWVLKNKSFKTSTHKNSYIMKIIENNIHIGYERYKEIVKHKVTKKKMLNI